MNLVSGLFRPSRTCGSKRQRKANVRTLLCVEALVGVGTQNLTLIDNTITLTGAAGTLGINVVGGGGTPTSLSILNNRIDSSGNGTGIQFVRTVAGGAYTARVEGNDLHFNKIGVNVSGNLPGSVNSIDLGGGNQGSRGANNFRGFTAAASANAGAIVTSALAADGPINAQMNLFGVANPEDVIFDQQDVPANADVIPTGNLTGNAAFVQALYLEFLHRAGDLTGPGDAAGWVIQLNNGASSTSVAQGVVRSKEAFTILADSLYRRLLNRDATVSEMTDLIAFFLSGGTLEQAINTLVNTQDYGIRFGSDGAFVESLYTTLLNRSGSNAEIAGWVAALPSVSRKSVAASFLATVEYRGIQVRLFYRNFLNRITPSDAEVNNWVNSGLDLLAIMVKFASSPEFQAQG